MEIQESSTGSSRGGGTPFQYNLRTMLIVMTALAVALSGIFAGPAGLSLLTGLFLGIMAPMVLTIGLIYGRGNLRTFCIGALFSAGLILFSLTPAASYWLVGVPGPADPDTAPYVGVYVLVAGVVIVVMGLVAVGVRWMIEACQGQREAIPMERSHTSDPLAPSSADRGSESLTARRFTWNTSTQTMRAAGNGRFTWNR